MPNYELVGSLDADAQEELDKYLLALEAHVWGGPGFERLVVTTDMKADLALWMPRPRYTEWVAGYASGLRQGITGAIHFLAKDGLRTAVVPWYDRPMFLALSSHEAVEACLEARGTQRGYEPDSEVLGGHVLWSEYVCERTRHEVWLGLGGTASSLFDESYIANLAADFMRDLPGLIGEAVQRNAVPDVLMPRWYELARSFAMATGRADAELELAKRDVAGFLLSSLVREKPEAWANFRGALRAVYAAPNVPESDHDERVYDVWWMNKTGLHGALGEIWDSRFAQASGQRRPAS